MWLVQVGQAVIQIAASRGLHSINFVRNREGVDALKEQLKGLGATHVATYDDLADKAFRDTVKGWTGGKVRLYIHFAVFLTQMLMWFGYHLANKTRSKLHLRPRHHQHGAIPRP